MPSSNRRSAVEHAEKSGCSPSAAGETEALDVGRAPPRNGALFDVPIGTLHGSQLPRWPFRAQEQNWHRDPLEQLCRNAAHLGSGSVTLAVG